MTTQTAVASSDLRQLVTVETIRDITAIADADAIEAASVRGWTVVVKKGEFAVGDPCVYFEIDSALPLADPRFEFLAARGTKTLEDGTVVHRLKTARLRGVYSQGLVMPLVDFPEVASAALTDNPSADLARVLGVTKYEPPLPAGMDIAGEFPTALATKTDSERAQNLIDVWDRLLAAGPWRPTEKVDGTSLTVAVDADGIPHVCSRNYELLDGNNVYWNTVHATGLVHALNPGEVVQAEIVGPGVQGNPLHLDGVKVVVFTFTRDGRTLPAEEWPIWVSESTGRGIVPVPTYDVGLPATAGEAVKLVDGIKSLVAPGRNAEGVVWHRVNGQPLPELGYRSTFKTISNKYLLKHDS